MDQADKLQFLPNDLRLFYLRLVFNFFSFYFFTSHINHYLVLLYLIHYIVPELTYHNNYQSGANS